MFSENSPMKLRGLILITATILFLNGCATYNALEGGREPDENSAFLHVSRMQEFVPGIGFISAAAVIVSKVDERYTWDLQPTKVILEPGQHDIVISYRYRGFCGYSLYGCLYKKEDKAWLLKLNAMPGHHYRGYARSEGDNYWAWIEDEATGEVVAGEKPPSTGASVQEAM